MQGQIEKGHCLELRNVQGDRLGYLVVEKDLQLHLASGRSEPPAEALGEQERLQLTQQVEKLKQERDELCKEVETLRAHLQARSAESTTYLNLLYAMTRDRRPITEAELRDITTNGVPATAILDQINQT